MKLREIALIATIILSISCLRAQIYAPASDYKTTVGADTVYCFGSWARASIVATQGETVEWLALDTTTMEFSESVGAERTFLPTVAGGYMLRTASGTVRFWVDVPVVDSVRYEVDTISCEEMVVVAESFARPTRVYNFGSLQWENIAQRITYDWYAIDSLVMTTKNAEVSLPSPMEDGAVRVVATNRVYNTAEAVDTIGSYGVLAQFTYEERERDVPNEVKENVLSAPAEVEFTNTSKGAYTVCEWVMGNLSRLYEVSPVYSFQQPGEHRVTLIVTDESSGCQSVDSSLTLTVTEAMLEFPNAFTPNGDNVNDEFRPAYSSLKRYEITIYNRWGRKVYHGTDPSTGWDGTNGNSTCAEGVYYYVAEGQPFDVDSPIKRKGSVTIIR